MSSFTSSSIELSSSISSNSEYTVDKIRIRLQHDKSNFKVIDNYTLKCKSKCWTIFGFPAKKSETDDYQRIPGFVSCRKCFKTYSYTSTTGTRRLNSHPCLSDFVTESKSPTFTTTQTILNAVSQNLK